MVYEMGFHLIYLEIDSKELIGMILKGVPCCAACGVLIDYICNWVPCFSFLKFSYIKKECNKVALALATEAASSNFDFVRLDECPPYILSFVQVDSI